MFSADRYLRRIGLSPQTGPRDLQLLTALQLAHLVHVPFENLHVYHHRGVRTDVEWAYAKIVEQRRGGWCFEVNGCFGALLRALGFATDLVSCQVWETELSAWGAPHDHLALVVHLDGERWLVDVGFGDNCLQPLPLVDGEHDARPRPARVHADGDAFVLTELMPDLGWEPQLRISLRPVTLDRFERRSNWLQSEPGLSWSEKPFATRALDGEGSRLSLRRAVLRRREGQGAFVDTAVAEEDWSVLLDLHFGLDDRLLRSPA